eukprot:3395178-Lingulodinium_polyedra.AAC.1
MHGALRWALTRPEVKQPHAEQATTKPGYASKAKRWWPLGFLKSAARSTAMPGQALCLIWAPEPLMQAKQALHLQRASSKPC